MMMLFYIEIYNGFCDMWLLSSASWLGWEFANNDNIYVVFLLSFKRLNILIWENFPGAFQVEVVIPMKSYFFS